MAQALSSGHDNISVIQGGFEQIEGTKQFDLVVAVNSPFAYLLTIEARLNALKRIHQALKPEGVIFLDIPNFLSILKSYRKPQRAIMYLPSGEKIQRIIQHDIDFHTSTFTHTDYFYLGKKLIDTQVHAMSIFSFAEINYFLEQVGFKEIMTFNSYGARQAQQLNSVRMLISAKRHDT